jgi:hypothetical protein
VPVTKFEALLGTRDKLDVVTEEVLVREQLTGTEYAVDTVSHDGGTRSPTSSGTSGFRSARASRSTTASSGCPTTATPTAT